MDGVVEGDQGMAAVATGLKEGGSILHAGSRMSVWYKPKDANWDEHLKHHGKTQRRRMRRWRDKMRQSARRLQRRNPKRAFCWIPSLICINAAGMMPANRAATLIQILNGSCTKLAVDFCCKANCTYLAFDSRVN
jgi:hypothetical protein